MHAASFKERADVALLKEAVLCIDGIAKISVKVADNTEMWYPHIGPILIDLECTAGTGQTPQYLSAAEP